MGKLLQLFGAGWKWWKELHEVYTLMAILGVSVPAGIPAYLGWGDATKHPWLVASVILIWGVLFLCVLAYYGYRDSKKISQQPMATDPVTQGVSTNILGDGNVVSVGQSGGMTAKIVVNQAPGDKNAEQQ